MTDKSEEILKGIEDKLDLLGKVMNDRFEKLKKVIADYLDLTANIALSSVKTSLKSV